jgi:hypothetical protein
MLTNRATLGALAIVGVVAAAGGGYFASRSHPSPGEQAVSAHDVTLPSTPGAVTETENSLAPAPAAAPVAPAAPVQAAPVVQAAPPAEHRPTSRAAAPVAPRQRPSVAPRAASAPSASAQGNAPMSAAIEPLESTTVERRQAAPEPPQKQYQELVIPADSVVGLQIDSAVSSDRAKVEDVVKARVTRDVKVRDQVAIPAGARAEGSVTLVDKGGRLKDQARLGIRFHTIVLADGTRLPVNTETIYRDGDSPARESAAKIGGGAVGGAVLGAIFGGKKGAIIGSTVGAGAGGAAVAASDASTATLPAGSTVTVRMSAPATVTVEK